MTLTLHSSGIQEFISILSKITGFYFEGTWKTLNVHVLTMNDPDGTISLHAEMHKDGFVKLYTILALFGKYLLSFSNAFLIPPRLKSLDAVAGKIAEIESHHLNLDKERVQMTESFHIITKSQIRKR